jgi:WD40 repeat protein
MAFHPDGHALLTAGEVGATRFWDARTGVPLGPPLAHASRAVSAAISPDGKTVLTACWTMQRQGDRSTPKGEVFRWDAASGAALGRLVEVP